MLVRLRCRKRDFALRVKPVLDRHVQAYLEITQHRRCTALIARIRPKKLVLLRRLRSVLSLRIVDPES